MISLLTVFTFVIKFVVQNDFMLIYMGGGLVLLVLSFSFVKKLENVSNFIRSYLFVAPIMVCYALIIYWDYS